MTQGPTKKSPNWYSEPQFANAVNLQLAGGSNGTSFTIMFWFKPKSGIKEGYPLVGIEMFMGHAQLPLTIVATKAGSDYKAGGLGGYHVGVDVVPENGAKWVFVAVSFDSETGAFESFSFPLKAQASHRSNKDYASTLRRASIPGISFDFKPPGSVTQFSVLNKKIDQTAAGKYKDGTAPDGALIWLPMNEGSGTMFWDHSGNNHDHASDAGDWVTHTVTIQVTEYGHQHIFPKKLDVWQGDKVEWLFAKKGTKKQEAEVNGTVWKLSEGRLLRLPRSAKFFDDTTNDLTTAPDSNELGGTVGQKTKADVVFKYTVTFPDGKIVDPEVRCRGRRGTSRRGG